MTVPNNLKDIPVADQIDTQATPAVIKTPVGWLISVSLIALVLLLTQPVGAQESYQLQDGQWHKGTALDPTTPAGQLQAIRKTLAMDDWLRARDMADQWIKRYPNHPRLVEAYLLRGDAKLLAHQYFQSLFDYEYVVRSFPASEQFLVALEREYQVAKLFASGTKRKFLGMRILSAASEAEEVFIRVQERAPGSQVGELASLALGDFYYDRRQMTTAVEAYDLFLTNYPYSQSRQRAMKRLIQASLATFKGPKYDPTGLIEAAQRIKAYEQQFPAAAQQFDTPTLQSRVRELLANKALRTAQWYDNQHQRVSAITMYQRIVRQYPQTDTAQQAIKRLSQMGAAVIPPPDAAPHKGNLGH